MLEYLIFFKILGSKAILKKKPKKQGFSDKTASVKTSFHSHLMKRFICLKVQKYEQSNKVQL